MKDLREIALRLFHSGDIQHALQLRDQLKIWGHDSTWPHSVKAPIISYGWEKLDTGFLNTMNSQLQNIEPFRIANPDLLVLETVESEYMLLNFSFELALKRLMQKPNFPKKLFGAEIVSPVSTWGRTDFFRIHMPDSQFTGYTFPQHTQFDHPTYLAARRMLIAETNDILSPLDRPTIPYPF